MGDKGADMRAGELVERHGPWLLNWFRLRGVEAAKAEDLVQEVLLRLLRNLPSLRSAEAVPAWLRVAARDLLRHESGRVAPGPLAADPIDPVEREGDERLGALAEALVELPRELEEVVLVRYARGLTYEEIAEVLGLTRATVQSRLRRALEQLRKRLGVTEGKRP